MKLRSCSISGTVRVLNTLFFLCGLLGSVSSHANTYAQLKSFGDPKLSGAGPLAPLIEGSDGALYGTTPEGGTEGAGVVFKFNKDGSGYTNLHSFTPSTGDGGSPWASVIEASDGNLYGTTQYGGTGLNTNGIVFKLNKDGSGYTNLHSFTDATSDGAQPTSSLIEASDRKLYGTTQFGGISNYGSIFKLNKDGSGYTNLHGFIGAPGDGAQPLAGLVQGNDGRLYGTTSTGGSSTNFGMVFRLNTNGTSYTNLHSFTYSDGAYPNAKLLKASNGVFYGTTSSGGSLEFGTVFKITSNGVFTSLFPFNGTSGWNPSATLIEGSNSVLYGTTQYGGTKDAGTVFKVTTNGTGYVVLRNFAYTNNEGAEPYAGLLKGTNGVLYGVTPIGGSANQGTAFKLNQDGTSYAVLRVFSLSGGDASDGSADLSSTPPARLVEGSGGVLYGTTEHGGTNDNGTVFKLNKDGSGYTLLRHFTDGTTDGLLASGILKGSDGMLYGVTAQGGPFFGGSSAGGTLFKLNTNGAGYLVLHNFGASGDGAYPSAPPIEASDGLLYGTTTYGGTNDAGAIYKLSKNGNGYTNLYRFKFSGGDGRNPFASLVEGGDGALYGTTKSGGSIANGNAGTVFKLNKNGSGYTNLHSFTNFSSDGKNPYAGLLKGSDGALYGTTFEGGNNNNGTVYKLNTNGSGYTVLHRFNTDAGEGGNPYGALVEDTNGALYGTTQNGGANDAGTVFKLNKDGTGFAVLCSFNSAGGDGKNPKAAVVVGTDAALYGTTANGGGMNLGSIFKLTLGTPPVISSQPMSGVVFDQDDAFLTASATGTGLTYQWYFNGLAIGGANGSDLLLTSLTPQMAGSYWVVVANASGSVTSAVSSVSYFRLQVSNQVPSLIIAGPTGLVYGVEFRNGLIANWQSLTNFTLTTSPKTVTDPAGANLQRRFYRPLFFP